MMGLFDPATMSFTSPDPLNFVAGDATVLKSRYDAAPGDQHLDAETGTLVDKLYDPDALHYTVYDEYRRAKKERVYGTKFVIMHGRIPFEAEQVVLDIGHVTGGVDSHEAAVFEDTVARLQRRAPGLCGVVYDMALHGINREHMYDLGLHTITKSPKVRKGATRSRFLGQYRARKGGVDVGSPADIWGVGGGAHLAVIVAGAQDFVALERVRTIRRKNKRSGKKRTRRYRWYNEYVVPDDPRVPPRFRGSRVFIRLDDPNFEKSRLSWAENIHAVAPGEDDWESLFDLRNPTESINSWIKSKLHGRKARAPAVGAARQHFALLCAALYANFAASLAWAQRLKRAAA